MPLNTSQHSPVLGNEFAGQKASGVLACIGHHFIREWGAVCVTGARDVVEMVSPSGDGLGPRPRGPACPRDSLDLVTRAVLEAVPARAGSGPAAVAVAAGVDLNTALGCLGALAAAGFVERCVRGWRLRKDA